MFAFPLRAATLAVAAIGLSGCAYNGLYSGFSVGYGDPYYGYGYPGYGYSRLGYGYGGYGFDPYWGWYDNFYYPGTGYYVYDVYRRPYRWTDAQRRYWTIRRQRALSSDNRIVVRDNWGDFDRQRVRVRHNNRVERTFERPVRIERSSRPARIERRAERAEAKASQRQERRSTLRASSDREDRGNRGSNNGHDREN
ncbi:MAG TPA: hypothetical protein VNJ05_08610 [Sphingomicrobium sp.]|nr:hypothetical protein [Sphingomicrobium sp.]